MLPFTAINNVVNFLVTVNAASNFLLYCALSDKYRKTVRTLVCGHKPIRKNILTSSRYNSGRTSTTFFSKSQSNGNFSSASGSKGLSGRNKVKKRFSITQEEFTNLQAETTRLKYPRLSITSSEQRKDSTVWHWEDVSIALAIPQFIWYNFQNSEMIEEIPLQSLVEPTTPQSHCSHHTIISNRHLRPSGSELSLTRSRSLEFPSAPRHSPHCKDNPHHFWWSYGRYRRSSSSTLINPISLNFNNTILMYIFEENLKFEDCIKITSIYYVFTILFL